MIWLVRTQISVENGVVIPDRDDLHYLLRVRRVSEKEPVIFCAGGVIYHTETKREGKEAYFPVTATETAAANTHRITCALAAADSRAIEEALRNGVEAGADHFYLFDAAHSSVPAAALMKRKERLAAIIAAAASQSRRNALPELIFARISDILAKPCNHLVLHPQAEQRLAEIAITAQHYCIWIGPEGGFSNTEIAHFVQNKVTPVSLALPILRLENAVTIGVGMLADAVTAHYTR